MIISSIKPVKPGMLRVHSVDGRSGLFNVRPFMNSPAFLPLRVGDEFVKVRNGGYYIDWPCGADLSADTIEMRWIEQNRIPGQARNRDAGTVKRTKRRTGKKATT